MKTLIALSLLFHVSTVSAQGFNPGYYSADWVITKVSPMCPSDIPAGAVCFGLGSIVEVKAEIGCLDKLVSKEFIVWENNVIRAQSLVKQHPRADVIRCRKPQVIQDTVLVPMPGEVSLINDHIEF